MSPTGGKRGKRARHGALAAVGLMAGCGGATDAPPATVAEPVEWTLAGPMVEIGAVDGDARYTLHEAVSALRLEDGRIVVLDAGTAQLRFYGSGGEFLAAAGGRGEGPGEFRRPVRMHLTHRDSILVYDGALRRESRFDTRGRFRWAEPYQVPEDEPFPRDVWLYGRNLVDGPRWRDLRAPVRLVLDQLPPVGAGFRRVIVDPHWRFWVLAEPQPRDRPQDWRVYDLQARPIARVTVPPRFEMHDIGPDYVVGRSRDSLDVESIRVYALEGAPEVAAPDPVSAAEVVAEAESRVAPEHAAILDRMRAAMRHAMAQQELFYSNPANDYRYAADAAQLEWPADARDLERHILSAGRSGYTLLVFHTSVSAACGLTVGLGGPVGWTPGRVLCR